MKALLLLQVLAGGAAATSPFHNLAPIVAASNPDTSDPGYKACVSAQQVAAGCESSAGGSSGLATAAPSAIIQCACCDGGVPVSTAYSSCSDYLSSLAPSLETRYTAIGSLYSMCSASSPACSGGPTATAASTDSSSPSSTLSSSDSTVTLASACNSMQGLYESCVSATPGFSSLPYEEQGQCYCCISAHGVMTVTDQMDQYARTCSSWAQSSSLETVYSIASTFATFCQKFSYVCSAGSTLPSSQNLPTSTSAQTTSARRHLTVGQGAGGQATTTGSARAPTSTSAATNMRVGFAAGLIAVAALAVAF